MARCTKMVKGAHGDRRCKNQSTTGKTTCTIHTAGRRKTRSRSRSRTNSRKTRQAGGRSVVRRQLGGGDAQLDAFINKLKASTAAICGADKEGAEDFENIIAMSQEFEADLQNVLGKIQQLKQESADLQERLVATRQVVNEVEQFRSQQAPEKVRTVFELQIAEKGKQCQMEIEQLNQEMKQKLAESGAELSQMNARAQQALDAQASIEQRLKEIDSAINKSGKSTQAAIDQFQIANIPQAPPLPAQFGGFRFW